LQNYSEDLLRRVSLLTQENQMLPSLATSPLESLALTQQGHQQSNIEYAQRVSSTAASNHFLHTVRQQPFGGLQALHSLPASSLHRGVADTNAFSTLLAQQQENKMHQLAGGYGGGAFGQTNGTEGRMDHGALLYALLQHQRTITEKTLEPNQNTQPDGEENKAGFL
jgi:hypothetical protein